MARRPAGTEDWSDSELAEWRKLPFWRRRRITFDPVPMIVAGVLALMAAIPLLR